MTTDPHPGVRPDWLALRHEDALDPDQPIIDAHHHLWDKAQEHYTADEFLKDAETGHRIVGTVFVEGNTAHRTTGPAAFAPIGETEMATAEGSRAGVGATRVAAGIVARADLLLGRDVGPVLDAHAAAAQGRFRGIRHSTPWHADPAARGSALLSGPGLPYDPRFRDGLDEIRKRGLVFDAWMYHTQLGDLVDLAQAMPGLKIILNHVGGPIGIGPYEGRRSEVFADWSHWIGRLARFPNVGIKLSGLGMRLCGFGFSAQKMPPSSEELARAWRPYIETSIEAFGAARSMFASNFPVDKGSASYAVVWNAFKRIASGAGIDEREALFKGAAMKAYSLDIIVPEVKQGKLAG
ncbi:MAG: amidohydrolase family protein [Jannaschia sp.]